MLNYHKAALSYLGNYYKGESESELGFGYSFIKKLADECSKLAHEEKITSDDATISMLATCFRYAGLPGIFTENNGGVRLLLDFSEKVNCSEEMILQVKDAIIRHSCGEAPVTTVDNVTWDALNYRLAMDDLLVRLTFMTDESQKTGVQLLEELPYFLKLQKDFTNVRYQTVYAKKHYTEERRKNENRIDKRIQRLTATKKASSMSDKETEDLFKIAFRNYVKLVDVADSKAALLIHVNSILISVVIGFVVSRSEKYPVLVVPAFIILTVAFLTILLAIMASRPQKNLCDGNKSSGSYQTFFFGSFDLIGTEFRDADFTTYAAELDLFFKGGREQIYTEIYKEVFNVRKVLSKKFTFLSYAYMVFLGGLLISLIAFFVATTK